MWSTRSIVSGGCSARRARGRGTPAEVVVDLPYEEAPSRADDRGGLTLLLVLL